MNGRSPRLVLSGSMSLYPKMLEGQRLLEKFGIPAVVPIPEDHIRYDLGVEEYLAFKRDASLHHFRTICDEATFGIYVMNGDKHGVRNYIGPNTFAEIAVAFSQGKRIYLLQDIPESLAEELLAWGVVPLRGSIERLVQDYWAHRKSLVHQGILTA